MGRSCVLTIVLVGCQDFYGLDETVQAPPAVSDSDGDGFDDSKDRCPEVSDPDQLDQDGDNIGDLCDSCPKQFNPNQHDEDNDNVGDVCDLCPILPDFQTDIDIDGIGDACDAMLISQRAVFDGFVRLDQRWQFIGPAWLVSGDAAAPATAPKQLDGLSDPGVVVSGRWGMEVLFEAQASWNDGDRVGIHLVDGGTVTSCLAQCNATGCAVTIGTNGVVASMATFRPVDITPRMRLRFNAFQSSNEVICELDNTYRVNSFTALRGTPVFVAMPDIRLAYVEVLD